MTYTFVPHGCHRERDVRRLVTGCPLCRLTRGFAGHPAGGLYLDRWQAAWLLRRWRKQARETDATLRRGE